MATLTTASSGLYANTSTPSKLPSPSLICHTGCRYLEALEPALASWTSANASWPTLRETRFTVDPYANTTSTSIYCNTDALSAYPTPNHPSEKSYTIDEKCNLVGMYARLITSDEFSYMTVTMSETTGRHVYFGQGYISNGAISTTDANGNPSCQNTDYTGWLSTPIGVYTGRVITTSYFTDLYLATNITVTNGRTSLVTWTSTDLYNWWVMPELAEYVPGVAAFSECTFIIPGGSPVALTPANEAVVPAVTLPFKQTSAALTSTSESPPETTSIRPPTTSDAATLPSSTSSRQQPNTDSSTGGEPAPSQGASLPEIAVPTQTRTSTSSNQEAAGDNLPDDSPPSRSSAIADPPASSQEEADEPIGPATGPARTPTPSQPDAPRSSAVPPSNPPDNSDTQPIVEPIEPSSSTIPSLGGSSPAIDIVRASPTTETSDSSDGDAGVDQPVDEFASYIAAGLSGSLAVDESDPDAYVLDNGATVSASGQAVVVSGTTFSALGSGSGVVAVAGGTSATVTNLSQAGSTSGSRVSVVPDDDGGYVLQDGSTVTAGGQAVSVSGTVYSALPSKSGLVVAVSGQSMTLDAASLPTTPPQDSPDAYILGGSVTVSAGGSAETISGTTYSALPSDSGILVVADGKTTTIAGSSIPGSDIEAVNSYVVGGSATISAGGSVVAISGTTYSALPSGSGVVVIEGGKSSTIGIDGGHLVSNATGSTNQQDDTAPYLGTAADQRARLGALVYPIVAVALLLACIT